jgi:hypothetical protein
MKTNIRFFVSVSVLLTMKNVSDKNCRDKTHILCSIPFFPLENRTGYEIVKKKLWTQADHR